MATPALTPIAARAMALCQIKRITDHRDPASIATRLFTTAWSALSAGDPVAIVADAITAQAFAATILGAIDADVLGHLGLADCRVAALDQALATTPSFAALLHPALAVSLTQADPPPFVAALARQPRAGATAPGQPRLVIQGESHADHCLVVAVLAATLAGADGDRATPFLAGLLHHAHNAVLPDSGFAGEALLGDALPALMVRLFEEAYATLPPALASAGRAAMAVCATADTEPGRAFHAADVIDRVTEMRYLEAVAAFTAAQAVETLELVHAGPLQSFHHDVLRCQGLL